MRGGVPGLRLTSRAWLIDRGHGRRNRRVDIDQVVDSGNGEYSLYGPSAYDHAYSGTAGSCPRVRADQGTQSGGITKRGPAHIHDQQRRAAVDDRKQVLADLVGVGYIDLSRQRDHRHLADP